MSLLETLKARNAADLRQLLETPLTYELCEEHLVARITAYAHVEISGALAVIVEARQVCWGGFIDTISADGFSLQPDGTIAPMKEADLWKHGY